ncbi:RND efflux system, hypothetical protein, NodT [Spirochaetia bacterium]|nr:RND efflux system, hypothetical protein, NodT [Spirochaetia bacterium]
MKHNLRGRGSGAGGMDGGAFGTGLSPRVLLLGALFCASLVSAETAAAQQTGTRQAAGNTASTAAPETAAPAKEKMRLTPDEAVSLAIKNNLSLESGRVTLDTKKRKSDLVWNQFLPDLALSGALSRANEKSEGSTLPLPPAMGGPITMGATPQWSVNGAFSASLTLYAALFAGIDSIRQDYRDGVLTYEMAKVQTERDVRKAYNSMLLLQENIDLLHESAAAAQRQVDMARANYNAGLAPQLTLLQAQVARENLRPTIDQTENGLKLSMAQFAYNLGLPYDTEFELIPIDNETNFISLDVADLISQATKSKPDILELKQKIVTLQSQRKAQALMLYTPSLTLSWNAAPAFKLDPWKDSWGDKDNWTDRGSFSIALRMSLNGLFPFTKEGQGLKDIDNGIRTASIGLAQSIRGTELDIYNTVLSLDRIRVTTEAQNRTVNLAQQSYRLTEDAYRAGLQDFLQVQNAELELRRARAGLSEQQFNYLSGLIDLEYAIGVPFGTLSRSAE